VVEFRLLGPVEVAASGRLIEVGPPQRCAVLAALAVDAGRPVTVETLIDRVWDDRPPEGARRALHAHITRIRRLLEHAGAPDGRPARLLRRSGGYLLDIDPDRVDLHRFRRLFDQARDPGRDDTERVTALRAALDLWRGEPLAGLSARWAVRTRQGWSQQHLDALLAWARAELAVNNPETVIGRLTDLIDDHPLLEPLVAVLMRALHAVGRVTDALDLYTTTRARLVNELGTEPGAELQRVHQAVLRDDLTRPDQVRAPQLTRAVPAQLPRDVRGFSGRRNELAQLDSLLTTADEQAAPVIISALAGTAGVGKTALAVHWAHQVRDRFPDGQLYVNLRGFGPSGQVMDPAEAVRRFLDALDVPPERIPVDLDAQAALYRSRLADRRMLIVLDNAGDTTQVLPLLPGTPTCLVLITSRQPLTGLIATDAAHLLTLDLLTPGEARQLLSRRIGADRVAAEPDAVEEIIARCARLPLALALVAARAAIRPRVGLHILADELRDTQQRWETLAGDSPATDVRTVFSWSYQALTPSTARLFRLLGLHPGPDIAAPAAASLAGVATAAGRPLLAELTRASLLVEHIPGRYTFHDLLRAYAVHVADRVDSDGQRHAAVHRVLDHYLHTAFSAAMLLQPARNPITLTPPRPGVTPEHLADHEQALAWFAVEHRVLLAAIDHATAAGFDTHTWQLAWTLNDFLYRRGHWLDWAAAQQAAVAAAQQLADPNMQARAHRHLGFAYTRLDRIDDAQTHLGQALDLYRKAGDPAGQAHTHISLAVVRERQGRLAEALDHTQQALDLYQTAGDRVGQADALNAVGWYHALLGDHRQALTFCQQALRLFQELDDGYGQAGTWDSLGYAHHHLGQHTQAIACYQHALDLCRDLGDRYEEADTLTNLGDTHHAAGNVDAAREVWQQALTILDQLDHPGADQVRAKLAALDPPPPT
jgi:DNA-binding SARP family transcriptional activator/tetratricopeptide (TPR) repeat protein